ncbi:hypothetical protein FKD06_25395 [Serratia sp. SRS-8-S-2018]|uniref:hypothetical protein n=1 Tax=Serratia sp. SRS-8-S-2018 TaxID=2591107 RepID=UPI0011405E77|nr:hypothetical protein [Serratia sp. SRS-8-S-2018]TPW38053.1 hypothetical protein FKD06_25395 [Serratia sp. SRS-8-S-2018]
MKHKASYFLFACPLLFSLNAYATECPKNDRGQTLDTLSGHVGNIHYNNNDYYPTFTLKEYSKNWLRLSYNKGLDTKYGNAMYALLLMAKSGNYKVQLVCTGDGRINEMTLLDDKRN